jgi:DNA segregation ATPase FtsK/SpoIIIE-like protein
VDKLVDMIIEEDMLETISNPSMPGSEERMEAFLKIVEKEIETIDTDELKRFFEESDYFPEIEEVLMAKPILETGKRSEMGGEGDELLEEARRIVIAYRTASVSLLQRKLKIGYARAGRLIDALERAGVVGPYKGSKAREVLIKEEH